MEKFKGKYRIPSARMKTWDYASEGKYFITICTKNRQHYFGEIVRPDSGKDQNEMHYSALGKVVEKEWLKTPEVRPDMNLFLGEYQVMPNHFHAVLIIGENPYNSRKITDNRIEYPVDSDREAMLASLINSESISDHESPSDSNSNPDINQIIELENQMILESNTNGKNKFAPQSKNLGSVMRGFKSAVTSYANDHNIAFGWQPRFYDHIIRNYNEYQRIAHYIRNNPANWKNDHLR